MINHSRCNLVFFLPSEKTQVTAILTMEKQANITKEIQYLTYTIFDLPKLENNITIYRWYYLIR
jgi:hypothetical protein